MDLWRRNAGVSSNEHLVGGKKFRKKVSHLVGNFLVEVHIVDSPYVICMKCSHKTNCNLEQCREIYLLDLYRVCTAPFAIACNLRAIILRRI